MGLVDGAAHALWRSIVTKRGLVYLNSQQLESAKRCFLRVLAWPGLLPANHAFILHAMTRYYKERNDWANMIKCCKEGLKILPDAKGDSAVEHLEERFLLTLADAAEGQGDMVRAREYDEKAKKIWFESGETYYFIELRQARDHRRVHRTTVRHTKLYQERSQFQQNSDGCHQGTDVS